MAATGDLRSLLGPATFNQIPSHAAGVLQELWTKTSDNLRLKEEKVHYCFSLLCRNARVDGQEFHVDSIATGITNGWNGGFN